ncbi:hypothetical protein AD998_02055 [bacterium 336/3]|nr:hypothetical protein AD998_02055 [bacterium 336/3]
MYEIYASIKNRLKDKVLGLKTIGLYNNQFETEEHETSFLYPATFISFPDIDYTNAARGSQQAKCIITIWIGFESYQKEDAADGVIGEEGVFLLAEVINKALHLYSDSFGKLSRIKMRTPLAWGNIYVVAIDYECKFTDNSAKINTILQEFSLQYGIEFVDKLNDV